MRYLLLAVFALALAVPVTSECSQTQQVWQRPYQQWSKAEAQTILQESPWAIRQKVLIKYSNPSSWLRLRSLWRVADMYIVSCRDHRSFPQTAAIDRYATGIDQLPRFASRRRPSRLHQKAVKALCALG